jgi:predicted nucleic acid-binding Zn ribbon protein
VVFEKDFRIGKAEAEVPCECGESAKRFFGEMSFVLKGGGWPGRSNRMNSEMTSRNEKAGERMRGTWEGTQPKLIDQR